MKKIIIASLCLASFAVNAQQPGSSLKFDDKKKVYEVVAGCGSCKFGMNVPSCPLAIKLDGKLYLVDGAKIDDFGDAHADDGFCNATKKAKVQGDTSSSFFKVTYFELVKSKRSSPSPSKN